MAPGLARVAILVALENALHKTTDNDLAATIPMRILLVEDDALVGDAICTGLRQDGFEVAWAQNATAAEAALSGAKFDLMILDLGLPGKDGIEVLASQRERGNHIPAIVLTARDGISDKVRALDGGADDYLVKPVDLDELSARIRAIARRDRQLETPKLCYGLLVLDPVAHRVWEEGRIVDVSRSEYQLLATLLEHGGKVVPRSTLLGSLYAWGQDIGSNTLEVHIHNLRKKLRSPCIQTVRGVGYQLEPEKSC